MINHKYRIILTCLAAKRSSGPQGTAHSSAKPGRLGPRCGGTGTEVFPAPEAGLGLYRLRWAVSDAVRSGRCSDPWPLGTFSRKGPAGPCWVSSHGIVTSQTSSRIPLPFSTSGSAWAAGPRLARDGREGLENTT